MPVFLKRLAILVVAILVMAGVDGAIRGLRMPPEAGTELSATTRELIAQARSRQQATQPGTDETSPDEDPSDGLGMTTADLHAAWAAELVHIVDARTATQYAESHIPRAFNIPFEEMATGYPAALDVLPFEGAIVVYCDGGECHASRNVASLLIDLGYENVTVFERGLQAWIRAGHPVETGGGAQ